MNQLESYFHELNKFHIDETHLSCSDDTLHSHITYCSLQTKTHTNTLLWLIMWKCDLLHKSSLNRLQMMKTTSTHYPSLEEKL